MIINVFLVTDHLITTPPLFSTKSSSSLVNDCRLEQHLSIYQYNLPLESATISEQHRTSQYKHLDRHHVKERAHSSAGSGELNFRAMPLSPKARYDYQEMSSHICPAPYTNCSINFSIGLQANYLGTSLGRQCPYLFIQSTSTTKDCLT